MMFKTLVAAALVFVASAVGAEANLTLDANGIVVERPQCAFRGKPVTYFNATPQQLSISNAQIAAATYHPITRVPAVLFNATRFKSFSPEFQTWVFAHECAHWQLNHLSRPYNPSSFTVEYEENDADCRAAKTLVRMNFSEAQLNTVFRDIREEQKRVVANMAPPPRGVVAKPINPDERVIHARQCMDEELTYRGGR